MRVVMLTLIPISLLFFVGASPVADASADGQEFNGLDTLWIVLSAVLVFFMQAGFAMVEAGLVRSKNAANVLMKNLLDFSSATLGYFLFGYAIMYGSEGAFSGSEGWMLLGAESPIEGVPVEAFWFFQAVFAGAAATIVAGAVAERMRFVAYLCYSFVICALIYPLVGHWVWGGGWLAELKFHDFAGSAVVHTVGATAGLVGAMILGPRIGKFNKDGSANVIPGHNLSMVAIGAFILWFGWYGFNAGSTLGMGEPDVVARVVANTTLAPSIAAVTAMATAWKMFGKPDLTLALNGALAGLVAITAPCASVSLGSSLVIGMVAGVLVVFGVVWLNRLRIDDPVGAVPVHGLCGIWGTLAVGIFGTEAFGAPRDGLLHGGGFDQLGIQALGVAAVVGFTAISMWIVFSVIKSVVGLRVSRETELRGLDVDEHGHEAYAGLQMNVTD